MIQDLVCGVNLHYYASLQYGTAKAYIPSFVNNQILEVSLPNFYYDSNKGYSSSWISEVVDSVSNNLRNYITNNISDFGFLSFNNAYVNWAPTDLVNNWFTGSEFNLPLVCYIEDVEIEDSSSSAPDYTDILLNIDNDLKNIAYCFTSNISTPANVFNNSLIQGIGKLIYCFSSNIATSANVYNTSLLNRLNSILTSIDNKFKQSISPEASITDIISALNTNIHNDLTNINTTAENKDTILLIDGQQEFKLRNKEEMDF